VWSLSQGKMAMSAHVNSKKPKEAVREMNEMLQEEYGIFHTTIQVEEAGGKNCVNDLSLS
jgi:Co/Zn/Cd efflux system component